MKVVTFGEIMLRLSPEGYKRFIQSEKFNISFGGGEANTAVSLANFGVDSVFVTKLPENDIGQMAVNCLRQYGVNTSNILRGGERIGVYYLEKGAAQRGSRVIYDRTNSAIALASANEFDWENIFKGASWFHITGITPAISEKTAHICLEACKAAREHSVTISCDLNYRKKLWNQEEARRVMSNIMQYVDVCIANEEDALNVFGIYSKNTDVLNGHLNVDGYSYVAKEICNRFGCKKSAITLRKSLSANDNEWQAMLYDGKDCFFSKSYYVHIVDRVGSGDSFAAALIYGMLKLMPSNKALEFATAASCLKHSIEGDLNQVSVDEVVSLMEGNASGRVQR
ncbi:MAG: PfkB family carbohydrate kinase [Christensenellales bacterium]|jgi:2-dehydro-3-deoxygluconokinase